MSLALVFSERTRVLNALFLGYSGPPFAICVPTWTWHSTPSAKPIFSLIFKTPEALRVLMESPTEITLGEAFISGELDVEGDLFSVFAVAEYLLTSPMSWRLRLLQRLSLTYSELSNWFVRGSRHSPQRDASSIGYHYDLPVTFYEPWLGPTLLYSAAYFRDPSDGLDKAQQNKLDLICRKLGLQRGDQFIDIGCGWGSLPLYAASQYGAEACGITISQQQAKVASSRIADAHLPTRCSVEVRDYRDALHLSERFDKMASIGMFEHVGLKKLREYFRITYELLKPGGVFLASGILRSYNSPGRNNSFIDRFVFPDGELPTLSEILRKAEAAGFEVRDVENLREHYAQTLRLWVRNLKEQASTLLQTVSERTFRIWLLYMAGSAAAFERGDISVCQILLHRPDRSGASTLRTREDWYANPGSTRSRLVA